MSRIYTGDSMRSYGEIESAISDILRLDWSVVSTHAISWNQAVISVAVKKAASDQNWDMVLHLCEQEHIEKPHAGAVADALLVAVNHNPNWPVAERLIACLSIGKQKHHFTFYSKSDVTGAAISSLFDAYKIIIFSEKMNLAEKIKSLVLRDPLFSIERMILEVASEGKINALLYLLPFSTTFRNDCYALLAYISKKKSPTEGEKTTMRYLCSMPVVIKDIQFLLKSDISLQAWHMVERLIENTDALNGNNEFKRAVLQCYGYRTPLLRHGQLLLFRLALELIDDHYQETDHPDRRIKLKALIAATKTSSATLSELAQKIQDATSIGGGMGWGALNDALNHLLRNISEYKIEIDAILGLFNPSLPTQNQAALFRQNHHVTTSNEPTNDCAHAL